LGGWQAELTLVPEIAGALGTALDFLDTIAASLVVNAQRMKANLDAYGEGGRDAKPVEAAVDELLADLAPYLS
jgi:adenylosuccinate lyase